MSKAKSMMALKNILIAIAGLMGIVAFIFMFTGSITVKDGLLKTTVTYKNVVLGSNQIVTKIGSTVTTANLDKEHALGLLGLPFIGYLLVSLAGIGAAIVNLFLNVKSKKIINLVLACLMVLGGIFIFFTTSSFLNLEEMELVKKAVENESYTVAAGFTTVLSGIFGIVGGLSVCASEFVAK